MSLHHEDHERHEEHETGTFVSMAFVCFLLFVTISMDSLLINDVREPQSFTLEPGDVISTGTPSGVGVFADPPHFLGDGARIVVEIEGIGALENTARFDLAGARE